MDRDEFRRILERVIVGDHEAIEQILRLYAPLIDHNSVICGKLDEDCRQYILLHITRHICKFTF